MARIQGAPSGRTEGKESELKALAAIARAGVLALLYRAADHEHNNAVVLREVLIEGERHPDSGTKGPGR